MANYNEIKNAAILHPTTNTDLGSDTNRFANVYMSGNILMNGTVVTASNVITPKVMSIGYAGDDTAADTVGGQTVSLYGTGFAPGLNVLVAGATASVVTYIDSTHITFTTPAMNAGTYVVYVINTDGGTAISIPGISYSGTPTWSTSAGNLGTVYETGNINYTLSASGDAPVTYSLYSGVIPTGATLDTTTGTITGTAPSGNGTATYNFVIRATDAQRQDTDRAFSLTVDTDLVTWNTPTNNSSISGAVNSAITPITLNATSAAGKTVTYSANSLPSGLSLSGSSITGTPTIEGNTSTTFTATASTTNKSASVVLNWSFSVALEPYWASTTTVLSADGSNGSNNKTFLDSSATNATITRTGTVTQGSFTPYSQTGWSTYHNASYFSFPASANLTFAGDFTIEAWINLVSTSTGPHAIFGQKSASSWFDFRWYQNNFQASLNGGSGTNLGGTVTAGTWNHVALVRSSGVIKLYVNGVVSATTVSNATTLGYSTVASYVGSGNGNNFSGYLSNVRIVNGTAVYTGNFTPSTTPLTAITGTVLLTCQDNRIKDNSSLAHVLTFTGAPSVQAMSPFNSTISYSTSAVGGSAYFDGTNYLQTTVPAIGTSDFTLETWAYWITGTTGNGALQLSSTVGGFAAVAANTLDFHVTSNLLYASFGGSARSTGITMSLNQWTHLAIVRISGVIKVYVNGVYNTTIGAVSDTTNYTATYLVEGGYISTSNLFSGHLSATRLLAGTGAGVYTDTFTVPTAPATATATTTFLANYTNSGIVDMHSTTVYDTVGDTQLTTAVKKTGISSIAFDGNGDYLQAPSVSHALAVFASNFTIECWVRFAGNNGTYNPFIRSDAASGFDLGYDFSNSQLKYSGAAAILANSWTPTLGTWYHIALVRTSGVTKYYVDGTLLGAGATDANSYGISAFKVGGSSFSTAHVLYGNIDDLRITKGIARYSANFTPSTNPLSVR